jgi:hypothetical protein
MCVFVEEAAESVVSMDVEAVESVRFGDRFGERPQGCRVAQGVVRPTLVVEGLELAETRVAGRSDVGVLSQGTGEGFW